jgi:urease accessory protein
MIKPQSNRAVPWKSIFALAAVLLTPLAHAHPGHDATAGFTHGFFHPFTGLDHALAMIAIGLWAAQRGGHALWAVPAAFVGVMALGGIAGATGITIPFMEQGVALSVLLLGILVAAAIRWPTLVSVAVAGLFALFHGHSHGAEMPADVSGFAYGAGFMLATALLHAAGIGAAAFARGFDRTILVQLTGGVIAAAGACLLLGI